MKTLSKRFWIGFLFCSLGMAGGFMGYLLTQQPKVFCNRESAGLVLLKGHYRSWSMTYSDGLTLIDGKFQPASFTMSNGIPVGMRKGYRWPKLHHVDMENMKALRIPTPSADAGLKP